MLSALRKRMDKENGEGGFTLIELLVVIIIIGILAAIAIPVFLNQRKKGVDASIKSDLRNIATSMETVATDSPNNEYPTLPAVITGGAAAVELGAGSGTFVTASSGNTIGIKVGPSVSGAGNDAYCLRGKNPKGSKGDTGYWYYDSTAGGLQAKAALNCTGAVTW